VGVILLICCVVGVFAFRNQRLLRLLNPSPIPATQANLPPTQPNTTPAPPPSQDQDRPTPLSNPQSSPAIEAAQQAVKNNPNDPDAHLGLSLAFWDAGQARSAYDELKLAADLAGVGNKDFFKKAAGEFYDRQAWVAAGSMYLRLVRGGQTGGNEPSADIMQRFRESVYKASEQPDMPNFLFFDRIKEVDQPLALIAQARHALYNGSSQEARIYLDQANKLKPDVIEALLLEGEMNFKDGKKDEAKQIFTILKANLGAPNWIRLLAESYYAAMP
jgi:predicted Zn-dependent protease